ISPQVSVADQRTNTPAMGTLQELQLVLVQGILFSAVDVERVRGTRGQGCLSTEGGLLCFQGQARKSWQEKSGTKPLKSRIDAVNEPSSTVSIRPEGRAFFDQSVRFNIDGVVHLHSKRLLHRDIKPGNIMLATDFLKLSD